MDPAFEDTPCGRPLDRGYYGPEAGAYPGWVPEESIVMNNRIERVIAYMVAATVVVSVVSFIAVIIGTALGIGRDQLATGMWPFVTILPLIGLPIGFVLIIVLLVVSAVRRGRATKDVGN